MTPRATSTGRSVINVVIKRILKGRGGAGGGGGGGGGGSRVEISSEVTSVVRPYSLSDEKFIEENCFTGNEPRGVLSRVACILFPVPFQTLA